MEQHDLRRLRQLLHQNAELSHQETKTQKKLEDFLESYKPNQIMKLCSGKSLLVTFDSQKPGPHIMFRADLDALPIHESIALPYSSHNAGVSHKCGHDGHMTLVASLASWWQSKERRQGKLGLLFQHAEELGEGAQELITDNHLQGWGADKIFGFHNLPGFAENTVVVAQGDTFASASCGLKLEFAGRSSHAAEPEKALTPIKLMQELLTFGEDLQRLPSSTDFLQITPVGFRMGGENYGVTPGDGELYFTLRSYRDKVLQQGLEQILALAANSGSKMGITVKHTIKESFPALSVDPELSKLVTVQAKSCGFSVMELPPFRWSEDFGHLANLGKICYFGLGIGNHIAPLHDPRYDFNDQVLEPYHRLLSHLLDSLFASC